MLTTRELEVFNYIANLPKKDIPFIKIKLCNTFKITYPITCFYITKYKKHKVKTDKLKRILQRGNNHV